MYAGMLRVLIRCDVGSDGSCGVLRASGVMCTFRWLWLSTERQPLLSEQKT